MKKTWHKVFTVCVFLCVAISLYMRGLLLHMPFEYDELFTAVSTDPFLPFSWIYTHYLLVDVHPPLYNLLLWNWNQIFPYGPEIWLRLPSLLMGVAALVLAWADFPKCFGKTARILFFAFIACHLHAIAYAQHARAYALVLLLAIACTFSFIKLFRRTAKGLGAPAKQWISFSVLSLFLCWSHYFGSLLVFLLNGFLLTKALRTKTNRKQALLSSVFVLLGFLPWLIPNIAAQLSLSRFSGNWWANEVGQWILVPSTLIYFLSTNWMGSILLGLLILWVGIKIWPAFRKTKCLPYGREMGVLATVYLVAVAVITLISLKTFLFMPRYFIAYLPCAYLALSLFLAPVLRKSVVGKILFVLFLLLNLILFWIGHRELRFTPKIPTRIVAQLYKDFHPQKEMFVIAVEGFPTQAMPAMYGFYLNRVFLTNTPVTELFSLDPETLNEVLKRKEKAFIWMPNCTQEKLLKVSQKWGRSLGIYGKIGNTCVLKIGD